MYFDDEKDFIDSDAELKIDEDGTVEWDDILGSDDDDDLIKGLDDLDDNDGSDGGLSADDNNDDDIIARKSNSALLEDEDDNDKALNDILLSGDDIQLEQDDATPEEDDALNKILQSDSTKRTTESLVPTLDESGEDLDVDSLLADNSLMEPDFDVNSQMEFAADNDMYGDDVQPVNIQNNKKASKAKADGKGNSTIIYLCALLFAVILAGGVYYFLNLSGDEDELDSELLDSEESVQDEMNNTTEEDIRQRAEEKQQETEAHSQQENIPVVTEDDASSVKPNEQETKKAIIPVIQTGRINPFEPVQKYSSSQAIKQIPLVRYDKVSLIKPPTQYGENMETTRKMLTIAVSGIMFDSVSPSAIINYDGNDYFVQKGDMLDEYKVVGIGKNFVAIALGTNIYKASVGEEFKISNVTGQANFSKTGRNYPSIKKDDAGTKDIIRTTGEIGGFRTEHVSENDVQIFAK